MKKEGTQRKPSRASKVATRRRSLKSARSSSSNPKRFCAVMPEPVRQFGPSVHPGRARAIVASANKWANGTVLRYFFHHSPARWKGSDSAKDTVRRAFQNWKSVGIGLDFKEVNSASEAEVRIGFEGGDGHWSYVGRAVLDHGSSKRTMNLDKRDSWGIDTAMHEIGHTLGMPHEHQNPRAGIEWDEEAVYAALGAPPNGWDRETTYYNIIRKLPPGSVQGSDWDPDSIMHYPFEPGLIRRPTRYQTAPLVPAPGLSAKDIDWVKRFYPPLTSSDHVLLQPLRSSPLRLEEGEQRNFTIRPRATRKYTFQTFGQSDAVMVLFEMINGEPRFLAGDDDSGDERSATLEAKLYSGREYRLRVRLYYQYSAAETAVMYW